MSNQNNCKTCEHGRPGRMPEGGHCYMFRDVPIEVCMQHTGRKEVGTIGHVSNYGSAELQVLILASLLERGQHNAELCGGTETLQLHP